jgi:hypothetical protein
MQQHTRVRLRHSQQRTDRLARRFIQQAEQDHATLRQHVRNCDVDEAAFED